MVAELRAVSPVSCNGDAMPIADETWLQTPCIIIFGMVVSQLAAKQSWLTFGVVWKLDQHAGSFAIICLHKLVPIR